MCATLPEPRRCCLRHRRPHPASKRGRWLQRIGVQYHWRGNHYAGINFHALAGATHGSFDHSNPGLNNTDFTIATGLYTNRTSAMGVAGGSVDFNRSARLAVRISPEIVFEHFGDELREFVSVSGGVVYRFGSR